MKPTIKMAGLVTLLVLLNACATTQTAVQPDPRYASVDLKAVACQPVANGSIF